MTNQTRAGGDSVAPYVAYGPPGPPPYPYGPPSGYGLADPYATNAGPAEPQGGGGRRVFLAIVSIVVGIIVSIALLVVVVPWVMGDRAVVPADPAEVEVTLPTHLHGWTKMEGQAETQMMRKAIGALPAQAHPRGAVYGRAGVYQAVIIVETGKLGLFQQKAALQLDARQLKAVKVTMRAVPPGPLGGLMQCGRSADTAQTICSFADDGMYGYVSLMGQPKDYLATVHAVRAAIEHRLG